MRPPHTNPCNSPPPRSTRDLCAHILIPLNKCRVEKNYMPFECVDLRHAYEACEAKL